MQIVGAVLAGVMGTAKVQGHSSGGGGIISPLLTSLGRRGAKEEEWEGKPQRRKRWKNLKQCKWEEGRSEKKGWSRAHG